MSLAPAIRSVSHTHQDITDALRLIRSENVGPVTYHALIKRFKTPARALEAIPQMAARGGSRRPISLCSKEKAEEEIARTHAMGAEFVVYGDAGYPALLSQAHDAPPVLAVLGKRALWDRPCVAMVGARNASANGCHFARKLARELGEAGYVVVSGLARGIDAFTHQGALASRTIAAIASGIDHIYPPENEGLYHQLREEGCIVSENPLGAVPHSRAFPARNRIISGLSRGVIVVEAAAKSGSLITARYALEQGREVMAVPGSPMDPRARGCNELIRQGAALIESVEDVLRELQKPEIAVFRQQQPDLFNGEEKFQEGEEDITKARAIVDEKLGVTPVSMDELMEQCQLSANTLLTILLEKELAGVLQRHRGGKVSLMVGS